MLQQDEYEKIIRECRQVVKEGKDNIARMQSDHQQWLVEQEQKTQSLLARPTEKNNAPSEQIPFNGQMPTPDELKKIVENPERFGRVFQELDDWFVHDRAEAAKQAQVESTERKWFGGDRVPSVEDMANPNNFNEMLRELENMT